MKQNRELRAGDRVLVGGYGLSRWRVVSIEGGLAHLTMLFSFERLDYRDVPVERPTLIESVVA